MEIDKTKQQKKLERFFMAPNYTPVLGLTVTPDTDIEDEEVKTDDNGKIVIKQKIKGLNFIIEEEMNTVLQSGEIIKSFTKREIELKEGTRLIWIEGKGYILPSEQFATIEEITENYNYLKE